MENCNELFLDEVVRVELVPAADCAMPVPFNVAELTGMNGCTIGAAALAVDAVDGRGDALMTTAPTLKTTEKPQAAGFLRSHDLQVPVFDGYEAVRQKKGTLAGRDFHVVMRTAAGNEYLLYGLPNTSRVSVEDQFGPAEPRQTVKVSLQSMSNMVRITRKQS